MEQVISIPEIKKLLPPQAKVEFQRKKGQTGALSLEISVKIVPNISEKEHDALMDKIIEFTGEDLIELYVETTGYHFYIYLRMSSTQPTTVII